MPGPLHGIKIVELASAGPGPMAAMLLADLGATVLRIERGGANTVGVRRPVKYDLLLRNRERVILELKQPEAVEKVLTLVEEADALIEGYRPGMTERLGLGPEDCLRRNPRLVYGRMTGWGQTGPLSQTAGLDLNYIALTGMLNAIGRKGQPPSIPLALLGDFGGGALYLVIGVLAAILEARTSGRGQVIDAAIIDGVASMATNVYGLYAGGLWPRKRGENALDSGSHFYEVYECQDGLWVSVGPIEERFYTQFLSLLGIDPESIGPQHDPDSWPLAKQLIAEKFKSRPREYWCDLLEGTDACFALVLSFDEAPNHPHIRERGVFIEIDGIMQPAPAPRFSRTAPAAPKAPQESPQRDIDAVMAEWKSAAQA